ITRMEATAEASLARMRERRKLGMAMAAMIRITETTRRSSIRENPLWLRINSPQSQSFREGTARETRVGAGSSRGRVGYSADRSLVQTQDKEKGVLFRDRES